MKSKIKPWPTVLLSVTAGLFICASVQAQIDWHSLDPYRNGQHPSGGGGGYSRPSNPAPAQTDQQRRQAAAYNEDIQGNNAADKSDWATADACYQRALEQTPNDSVILRNLAAVQSHESVDAYKNGDYATALKYDQQALANDPVTDPEHQSYIDGVNMIQAKIADAQREQDQRKQDKIAANNIQQNIQNFAQTLSAAPSSGGLDFDDGKDSTPKPALEFGDPMVVDARNVPSGLPIAVDNAITGAFHDVSPEALLRIRKGMEAVMLKDWNMASADFQDALNHDPSNPNLIQFVKNFHEAMQSPVTPAPLTGAKSAADEDKELIAYAMGSDSLQRIRDTDPRWKDRARAYKKLLDNAVLVPPQKSDMEYLNTLPSQTSQNLPTK